MKEEEKDIIEQDVYKTATRRVGFKIHFTFFVMVLTLLWIIWAFIFKKNEPNTEDIFLQALLFLNLIWLLIIISHYLIVYRWNKTLIEKEIKKIEKKKEKLIRLKTEEKDKNHISSQEE